MAPSASGTHRRDMCKKSREKLRIARHRHRNKVAEFGVFDAENGDSIARDVADATCRHNLSRCARSVLNHPVIHHVVYLSCSVVTRRVRQHDRCRRATPNGPGRGPKKNFRIIGFSLAQSPSRCRFDRIEGPTIHATPRPSTQFTNAQVTRACANRRVRVDDLTPPTRSGMSVAPRVPAPQDARCTGKKPLRPENVPHGRPIRAIESKAGRYVD